ncbi:hypothetical protein FGO68_gene3587 [Halteria grandinella]|uniref:Uncharacterized protein n=1 Tax=Halteria grandinella TaxID=5974 RepID=A0A8J8SZY6_HALGN|nr:hypothetical protein FGO68_gene3587 [Halteria grandinella]
MDKIQKVKIYKISISQRVETGRCLTCFEACIYFLVQTALTVATGILLYHPKEGYLTGETLEKYMKVCNDSWTRDEINGKSYPKYASPCKDYVNIYSQWSTVLQLFFAFYIIQWARMFLIFCAVWCRGIDCFTKLFDCLGCTQCCYGIASIIILHVYRFQPAGRVAAMDYLTMDEHNQYFENYKEEWSRNGTMPESGQYFRGRYLLGLVIYIWGGGFLLCCLTCCLAYCHYKKYGQG